MKRGEIRWYTCKSPDKRRPVLVLTRNDAIRFLTGVTVAPITTTIRDIPAEVLLTPEVDGVPMGSVVNMDNIQTVQKSHLGRLITTLSSQRMHEVDHAICFALGVDTLLHSNGHV